MYEDEQKNNLYIGNLVEGSRFRGYCAAHAGVTQAVCTLITLIIFLELYASMFAARNFFAAEQTSYNPLKIFFGMGDHPVAGIIVLALSVITGKILTSVIINEKDARYVQNSRGEYIDRNREAGRGEISTEDEISTWAQYTTDQDTHGIIVGEHPDNGKIICKPFDRYDYINMLTNNNVLLAGPAGVGKTTSFILPNILSHLEAGHSLIIFDPKGDIYSDITPAAIEMGYRMIRIFNMRTDELEKSDGWDVLKPIRTADNSEIAADSFADCILRNISTGKQDFWNNSNKNLLSLLFLYVASAKGFIPLTQNIGASAVIPEDMRVFKECMAYIENPDALSENVQAAMAKYPEDEKLLKGRFTTWAGNKEARQIASGLSTALSVLRNKTVAEVLSKDDIDIEMLDKEKSIIFVIPPLMDEVFQPITSLFFMSAIDELVKTASKKPSNTLDRMVYLILEEFASIGQIPKLRESLNTVRSFNIAMMLCVQQVADIKGMYAEIKNIESFKAIFENCVLQICMGATYDSKNGDFSNASYFSAKSGIQTIRETTTAENRNKLLPESLQEYTVLEKRQNERSKGVPVYMPDDILRLKGDEMLVFPSMHNSFMCKKFFWERHPLSNFKVWDRKTGAKHTLKTCDHIPHYKSGSNDLFDPDLYEVRDKRFMKSGRKAEATSGISYSALRSKKNHN